LDETFDNSKRATTEDIGMSTFHLSPPPQFCGLNPDLPIRCYERHLPHWRQDGATYFVTFRLADALPQQQQQFLRRLRAEWERTQPRSEEQWKTFAKEYANHVERWSDEGYGECWFRDRRWAQELIDRLLHFQNQRHFTSCYVIMPNHCHAIVQPFPPHELEELLQAAKSLVARSICRELGTSRTLWQQESFDRIIRDEEHLWRVIQYIGNNPARAGLTHEQAPRWIHPTWEACGWRFVDV
jgi:REP element-mobilizing transposase RayT